MILSFLTSGLQTLCCSVSLSEPRDDKGENDNLAVVVKFSRYTKATLLQVLSVRGFQSNTWKDVLILLTALLS